MPKGMPSIIEEMPRRMVVIGDVHGDLFMTIKCLLKGQVIEIEDPKGDKKGKIKWVGGDTLVVQMGDQVDGCRPYMTKCNECDDDNNLEVSKGDSKCHEDGYSFLNPPDSEVQIMDLFDDLHKQAEKEGGGVYCLIGNHELMNVDGNLSYVSGKNLEYFKKYIDKDKGINNRCEARRHVFAVGNEFAKRLARTRVASLIVGDWLFVHGGITKDIMNEYKITKREDIIDINRKVKEWLEGSLDRSEVEYIIGKKSSGNSKNIFWNRVLGKLSEDEPKENCDRILNDMFKTLKINHIVVGHTPQINGCDAGGVNCTCDDRVCRVDVGVSEAFNFVKAKQRKPDVLIVEDGVISTSKSLEE